MKRLLLKQKTIQFSLLLCGTLLLPMSTKSQDLFSGGLFGLGATTSSMDGYRGSLFDPTMGGYNITTQIFGLDVTGGYQISTQQFGQEAPLGSGWLVLTMAGVAYAFKKRKNNDNS